MDVRWNNHFRVIRNHPTETISKWMFGVEAQIIGTQIPPGFMGSYSICKSPAARFECRIVVPRMLYRHCDAVLPALCVPLVFLTWFLLQDRALVSEPSIAAVLETLAKNITLSNCQRHSRKYCDPVLKVISASFASAMKPQRSWHIMTRYHNSHK